MRVMVIVKANQQSEAGILPSEQLMAEMGKFNEELVKAGVMLAGEGLRDSSRGVRINIDGDRRTVVEGPFDLDNLACGFWLWRVKSLQEAIDWAKRCPNPHAGGSSQLEIRPLFEAEDFGENLTPELRAQEDRLRAQAEKLAAAGA
jgi:hypothetical protein